MRLEYKHDPDLDALVKRISAVVDGEDMANVALCCTMIAAFSLARGFEPEERDNALEMVITFMRETFTRAKK